MEDADKSKALDINTEFLGISPLLLMENAGRKIADAASKFENVAIFCGKGNNGGDGFVAARHLSSLGKDVSVFFIADPVTTEAEKNLSVLECLDSIDLKAIKDSSECQRIDLSGFDCVIDAVLGVGAKGALREPAFSIVSLMNSSKAYKIAVDCPTPGFESDKILAFHFAKNPGAQVESIGIPREAEALCGPGDVYRAMPPRSGEEHKGDMGRVLVVGSSRDFPSTSALVGKAALRTGADLALIASPSYAIDHMPHDPDLILKALDSQDFFSDSDVEFILSLKFDSIVIGNGLGLRKESKTALKKLLKKLSCPLVLDADALKLIDPEDIKENFILTPHRAEFEALFGSEASPEEVEKQAAETGCVIVLKGEVDIVSDGENTKANKSGNPGMTVGGTGDVLAGIIGCLSAKSDPFNSACAGCFLSGLAGDLAWEKSGFSLLASDCIESIPDAIKFCEGYW